MGTNTVWVVTERTEVADVWFDSLAGIFSTEDLANGFIQRLREFERGSFEVTEWKVDQ